MTPQQLALLELARDLDSLVSEDDLKDIQACTTVVRGEERPLIKICWGNLWAKIPSERLAYLFENVYQRDELPNFVRAVEMCGLAKVLEVVKTQSYAAHRDFFPGRNEVKR